MDAILSPSARKCALKSNGFLCYEEDCDENVVFRELLDKKLWDVPDRVKDKAGYEERINDSLRKYHPEYWRTRQAGLENHAARPPAPARHTEI